MRNFLFGNRNFVSTSTTISSVNGKWMWFLNRKRSTSPCLMMMLLQNSLTLPWSVGLLPVCGRSASGETGVIKHWLTRLLLSEDFCAPYSSLRKEKTLVCWTVFSLMSWNSCPCDGWRGSKKRLKMQQRLAGTFQDGQRRERQGAAHAKKELLGGLRFGCNQWWNSGTFPLKTALNLKVISW